MRRFRFRTLPFVATILLVALGIALGNWQTRRAEQKTALFAKAQQRMNAPPVALGAGPLDPGALEYRHVVVDGEFRTDWPIYLDNRQHLGAAGFNVLMPFRIAEPDVGPDAGARTGAAKYVLVELGWLPRNAQHDVLFKPAVRRGRVRIHGIAVLRPERVLELGTAPPLKPGAIVLNAGIQAVARASGLAFQPLMLEQFGTDAGGAPLSDGLVPVALNDWTVPGIDVSRHRGYAFQWYALAAMASLFYVITGFRSASKPRA